MIRYLIVTVICCVSILQTQPLPSTDIYFAKLNYQSAKLSIEKPINITQRIGYDNQPSFHKDGRGLFFTSIREDDQADVYQYLADEDTVIRITTTMESEYSPTLMPDGKQFSVVRVERDSTQRLWKFDLNGNNSELIMKTIKPVGYHCWIDSNRVALFILGEPNTLQLVDIQTEEAAILDTNIGRSLHRIPGKEAFSYVQKQNDSTWFINEYNLTTNAIKPLIQTLKGSEDLAWTPNGEILMGQQSKLFMFDPRKDSAWKEIADYSEQEVRDIKRLAVSRNGKWMAIVANDGRTKNKTQNGK